MLAMPTLHVRNVPEPLYDALRDAAARNSRSIGAETISLLTTVLFGRRRRFPLPGSGPRTRGTLAAFAPEARDAIADAERVARELGHEHVGTEHLLLALSARP